MDGVSLVTLDVDNMYNNITEDLCYTAVRNYLEKRNQQTGNTELAEFPIVSSSSSMLEEPFWVSEVPKEYNAKPSVDICLR